MIKSLAGSILVLLLCQISWAATIPGRWEKLDSLSRGTPIFIDLKQGARIEAFFQTSDNSGVTVLTPTGSTVNYRKEDIRTVTRRRAKGDSNWDGTMIGAGIGGGAAAGIGALAARSGNDDCPTCCDIDVVTPGRTAAIAGAVGAAGGGILGFLIDKGQGDGKTDDIVYQERLE